MTPPFYSATSASAAAGPSADPATAGPPPVRATWRFMVSHAAHWVALGCGAGLSRWMPGTVGTLWAWAAFLLLQRGLSPVALGWVVVLAWPIGWWACSVTARHMAIADPGSIVWDEVAAFWLILWLVTPAGLWMQLWAFVLFRLFDTLKPGPIKWADSAFKPASVASKGGGWWQAGFGIMADDFLAAFATLLVIAIGRAW